MEYNFKAIEKKWQEEWKKNDVYRVTNHSTRPKFYVLDMFPYPSGAGLHVGHPLGYIASDIYARYKRLKGFNVLHPMGFDAFGLPAEQYAIDHGIHPAVSTENNINTFRGQLDNIGFCYDWSREVRTCDPQYYKWTQWIFLQLFDSWFNRQKKKAERIKVLEEIFEKEGNVNHQMPNSKFQIANESSNTFSAEQWKDFNEEDKQNIMMQYRLAYLDYADVWWCEALGTVLANDEVVNGVSERGGHSVIKKKMRQWFLRITEYADRLLQGLEQVEFTESLKEQQKNWIGKSFGAEISFRLAPSPLVESGPGEVRVFTTRPDTIFGVDFMVLAPEHELVKQITTAGQKEEVEKYLAYVNSRSDRERMAEVKQITGCFTGAYALNPFNEKKIPVWISEYVLIGYGTGAIMAVPCGDQRDFDFARHFGIPVTNIIGDYFNGEEANPTKDAILENSDFLNGILMKNAIELVIDKLEEQGIGKRQINYKMHDAGFSRQRYWGEPFPIVYKDGIPYAINDPSFDLPEEYKKLPVELPHVDSYSSGPEGEGPLANLPEWYLIPNPSPQGEKGKVGAANVPKYSVHTPVQYELARTLRKEHTEAENALWQVLRDSKLGVKFRRQHPIDAYIVDFVALQNKLIVEADGGYHESKEQKKYDEIRTKMLKEIGFDVLRFNNEEILKNPYKIKDIIKLRLSNKSNGELPTIPPEVAKSQDFPPLQAGKSKKSEGHSPSPLMERGPGGEVKRETNTMPGYAGSSWYFLRYMDPHNENEFCDRKISDYWGQVDLYIGGTEHAVGHLLYSRLWTKVLYDLHLIGHDEPYKKLVNQGMITGRSYFFNVEIEDNFDISKVKSKITSYDKESPSNISVRFRYGHQYVDSSGKFTKKIFDKNASEILIETPIYGYEIDWKNEEGEEFIYVKEESEKMSKSKYNVENPNDIIDKYGADTFRMYEMFLGPVEQSKPWDTKGIEGVHRFLKKFWRLFYDEQKDLPAGRQGKVWTEEKATDAELKVLHKTIKKIEEDTERFSFNTAVSTFMIAVNELTDLKPPKRSVLEPLLILLTPYAPHVSEELWHLLGHDSYILDQPYPLFEEKYLIESSKEYPISINGKLRTIMNISLNAGQSEIEEIVLKNEVVQKWIEGKSPKKIIFVKGKMVNVVL